MIKSFAKDYGSPWNHPLQSAYIIITKYNKFCISQMLYPQNSKVNSQIRNATLHDIMMSRTDPSGHFRRRFDVEISTSKYSYVFQRFFDIDWTSNRRRNFKFDVESTSIFQRFFIWRQKNFEKLTSKFRHWFDVKISTCCWDVHWNVYVWPVCSSHRTRPLPHLWDFDFSALDLSLNII